MPSFPGRARDKRAIRAVIRFPDSTEIRHLDGVPAAGSRLRSESGQEWFVVEAVQSGRDTYTILCGGRDALRHAGIGSMQARVQVAADIADDLLQRVRRSVREQYQPPAHMAFLASFMSAEGRLFQDLIRAESPAKAESEALRLARSRDLTLTDIQRGPDWWLDTIADPGASRRFRRLASRIRRLQRGRV